MRKVIISLIYVSIVLTIPPGSYLSGGKILPTNAMNYKDKYILFYLEGKKALSEKRVSRILGISSPDNMPDGYHGQDPRIWVYIKDK